MTLPQDPIAFLQAGYAEAVARAQPARVLPAHLPPPPRGRTLVLGAGKAAAAMAAAVEACWPAEAPLSGLVITRYGHIPAGLDRSAARIEIVEAAHPVPDAAGIAATQRLLSLTQDPAAPLGPDDLVLCLISGGGSALLSAPAPGVSVELKQAINRALLASGAPIDAMNAVRKHLSAIKGGRLAARCAPARVLTLAISDVPGDDPAVIASGPTVGDPTHCADALRILDQAGIEIPDAVRAALQSGALETPKPGSAALAHAETRVVASPMDALQAAAAQSRAHGIPAHILSDRIEGESRVCGGVLAEIARSVAVHGQPFQAPCLLLSGGETTVTLRPGGPKPGLGGRACEWTLAAALTLGGQPRIWGLAADTDGIDGSAPDAGAHFTPTTLAEARAAGIDPAAALERHDSHAVFAALGALVQPGPTHTNVNDYRALLVLP